MIYASALQDLTQRLLFQHIGADYCITPASSTATLLTGLSAPEVTIAAVEFYTTCGGSSPFQTSFDFALEYFTLLNNTLDSHFNEMEQYLLAAQDETICLYNIRQEVQSHSTTRHAMIKCLCLLTQLFLFQF